MNDATESNNISTYIGIEKENEDGACLCLEYPIPIEIFVIALVLCEVNK